MLKLGKKDKTIGISYTNLTVIGRIFDRPKSYPYLTAGKSVLCGYNQGLGEDLYLCENLQDMLTLYDAYAMGGALNINWYSAEKVMNVLNITLGPEVSASRQLVDQICPKAPEEVKVMVSNYAAGNFGAARVLASKVVDLDIQDPTQIEKLVGWPLSENSFEKASDIWNKFKNDK